MVQPSLGYQWSFIRYPENSVKFYLILFNVSNVIDFCIMKRNISNAILARVSKMFPWKLIRIQGL